jgi:hypothetical protein
MQIDAMLNKRGSTVLTIDTHFRLISLSGSPWASLTPRIAKAGNTAIYLMQEPARLRVKIVNTHRGGGYEAHIQLFINTGYIISKAPTFTLISSCLHPSVIDDTICHLAEDKN